MQLVMPSHSNATNRLFGGQLMAWIDIAAGVEARRHSHHQITTACVDHLDFLGPAYIGDIVVLKSKITWTGQSSMEVLCESFVEDLDGTRKLINRAYLVFVALDDNESPVAVPAFIPQTDGEQKEWAAAEKRHAYRKALIKKQKGEFTI